VPVSSLGAEFFVHDDKMHALVGERTGKRWSLGMGVEVKLVEATPVTGGLLFEMLSDPLPPDPKMPRPRLGARRQAAVKPRGGLPKGVRRGKRR
jgi:ribonuclease R